MLLRHGKSDWDVDVRDFDRPLKDRGKRGAQRIGVWLQQQDLRPDLILSSPANRALETARKCGKVMGIPAKQIQTDSRIYLASVQQLMQVLAEAVSSSSQRVLLVGHNPGLEDLLCELADSPVEIPTDGKLLPTATLARLAVPIDWSALKSGRCQLLQVIRAKDLPETFPFPSAHGFERRQRPAYYYTQSSVIPYRIRDAKVEILLIQSSKNKHWVVPKGIADPGHSLQESAAKEAWEEAGIEGWVMETAIGNYHYEKWGANCHVTVFAMEVQQELAEHEWQERHRSRQWLPAHEAAELLKQAALGPMVLALEKELLDKMNA